LRSEPLAYTPIYLAVKKPLAAPHQSIQPLRSLFSGPCPASCIAISDGHGRVNRVALENNLNCMWTLVEAGGVEYADHPGGTTGILVKDYRGRNAEQDIWKFDATLVTHCDPLNSSGIGNAFRSDRGRLKG